MIYCLIGRDRDAKQKKIEEFKSNLFESQDYFNFDYENLHAHKLEPDALRQAFLALPVIASQRLLIIREAEKLSAPNKKHVLEFLQKPFEHVMMVLDFEDVEAKDDFLTALRPKAKVLEFSIAVKANVFDMTRAISLRNSAEALRLLDELIALGNHPLQLMGALVWFWGRVKEKLSRENFQDGLSALQEADLNIKRSRLNPKHAVEVLVVKLCQLV